MSSIASIKHPFSLFSSDQLSSPSPKLTKYIVRIVNGIFQTPSEKDASKQKTQYQHTYWTSDYKKQITDSSLIRYCQSLGVPPGYPLVFINMDTKHSDILSIARDIKGRTQYKYTSEHIEENGHEKFIRMIPFIHVLPLIRKKIIQLLYTLTPHDILEKNQYTKEQMCALALYIMDYGCFRVGNKIYEDESDTFGVSNLQPKHIQIRDPEIKRNAKKKVQEEEQDQEQDIFMYRMNISFIGKSGMKNEKLFVHHPIENSKSVRNRNVRYNGNTKTDEICSIFRKKRYRDVDFLGQVFPPSYYAHHHVINLMKALQEKCHWVPEIEQLFHYPEHTANNKSISEVVYHPISSHHINEFLHQFGTFSAKDFRTLHANGRFIFYVMELFQLIHTISNSELKNSDIKKITQICLEKTANDLHHTKSNCKKSYLCPEVLTVALSNPALLYVLYQEQKQLPLLTFQHILQSYYSNSSNSSNSSNTMSTTIPT